MAAGSSGDALHRASWRIAPAACCDDRLCSPAVEQAQQLALAGGNDSRASSPAGTQRNRARQRCAAGRRVAQAKKCRRTRAVLVVVLDARDSCRSTRTTRPGFFQALADRGRLRAIRRVRLCRRETPNSRPAARPRARRPIRNRPVVLDDRDRDFDARPAALAIGGSFLELRRAAGPGEPMML